MDAASIATAAISIQQSSLQQNLGINVVKQQAQAQQEIVNVISNAIASNGRGQNLNISV